MKELRCHKCNMFLGEILKGKIKKGTILLCTECAGNKDTKPDVGMPDFMNEIFKGMGNENKKR